MGICLAGLPHGRLVWLLVGVGVCVLDRHRVPSCPFVDMCSPSGCLCGCLAVHPALECMYIGVCMFVLGLSLTGRGPSDISPGRIGAHRPVVVAY